jgi:CHAT domain-containing protein/tetratricopeptide (TPR) repeat protein
MNKIVGLIFIFYFPLSAMAQQESVIERRFRVSDSLALLGLYDNAIRALDSVIVYYPKVAEAYRRVITLEEKRNNHGGAFDAATGWVSIAPDDYEANIQAGWYGMLGKKGERAGHYLYNALKVRPFNDKTYRYLFYFYLLQDNEVKLVEYMVKTGLYAGSNPNLIQAFKDEYAALGRWVRKLTYDSAYIVDYLKQQLILNNSFSSTKILDSIKLLESENKDGLDKQLISYKEKFIIAENKVPENIRRRPLIAQCYIDLARNEFLMGSKEKFNIHVNNATTEWLAYNDLEGLAYNYLHLVRIMTPDYPLGLMLKLPLLAGQKMNDKNVMHQAYYELSNYFMNFKMTDSALFYLKKSYDITVDASDKAFYYFRNLQKEAIFRTAEGLNRIYRIRHNLDSALYYAAVAQKHHSNPRSARHLFLEAITYQDCKDYAKAKSIYEKIMSDDFSFKTNVSQWIVFANLGRCYLKMENFPKAQEYLIKSLNFEMDRESLNDFWDNPAITRENTISDLRQVYVKTNNADSLFSMGEWERKRNALTSHKNFGFSQTLVTLSEVQAQLKPDEACIQYFSHDEYGMVMLVFNNSQKRIIRKSNEELESIFSSESLKVISAKVIEESASFASQFGLIIPSSDRIGLLMSQFAYRYNLYVGKYKNTRGIKLGEVKSVDNVNQFKAIEACLYEIFFKPAQPLLTTTKKLFLNTIQESQFIPFDVLRNQQDKYLTESYAITYVPSFTVQAYLKGKPRNPSNEILMIGNPDYGGFSTESDNGRGLDLLEWGYKNWTDLPGTEIELKTIAGLSQAVTILQQKDISESIIKKFSSEGLLKKYSIIHFALHGLSPIDSYEYISLIVTESTNEHDGFLQFREILGLDLNAELVCLSACETALPSRDMRTLKYYNLSDAFLYAGAKNILASSWKIDDDATAVFMRRFYENLFESNKNYAWALQKTKMEFIRGEHKPEWKSPSYWGAFKLIGY